MKDTILIDNSPTSYMLQPECGLPILSWYDDMSDRVLPDYIPMLTELAKIHDVRDCIPKIVKNHNIELKMAIQVCKAFVQQQAKVQERQQQQIAIEQQQ